MDDVAWWTGIRERFESIDCGGLNPPGIAGSAVNGRTTIHLRSADIPRATEAFLTVAVEAGRSILLTGARQLFGDDLVVAEDPVDDSDEFEDAAERHEWREQQRRLADAEHAERWYQFLMNRAAVLDWASPALAGDEEIYLSFYSVHDAREESLRACDWIMGELRRQVVSQGAKSARIAPVENDSRQLRPKMYHRGWREILNRLHLGDDETQRRRVSELNRSFEGPIIIVGQGAQPFVEDSRLIAWWNTLEERFQELANRQRDRNATVDEQFLYGTESSIVVPELGGSVKPRRTRKK